MKKLIALVLVAILSVASLAGCQSDGVNQTQKQDLQGGPSQ